MTTKSQDWRKYERLVASMLAREVSTDLCVTPNARIKGGISGRSRQIDVLIDLRHDTDNDKRIIVDAKCRRRKVDVKDVEAFIGLMEDVKAARGYLITPVGATRSAVMRAQNCVSISLVSLEHLEAFDPLTWPRCRHASCKNGRVFWDGFPEVTFQISEIGIEAKESILARQSFVYYVGKCDSCGGFHVWCRSCNEVMAPTMRRKDVGHRCRCSSAWFWLASIEMDEDGRRSAELHLCRMGCAPETVDRRSL